MDPTDEEIEQLRRDSPPYAGDEGWEDVPLPMGAVLSVRFDIPTMRQLISIARATQRTPSGLLRDWTIERLSMPGSLDENAQPAHAIGEGSPIYPDNIEDLRRSYRPDRVRLLLVGESSPASGRFFYRANSNLFYATRDAFSRAFGDMPSGEAFLHEFKRRGAWLVDLADRPVNRMRGRPRADAVDAGIDRLAEMLREHRPELVIGVKATLEGAIRRAAHAAGLEPERVHVLQFPVRQWRAAYIRDLVEILASDDGDQSLKPPRPSE